MVLNERHSRLDDREPFIRTCESFCRILVMALLLIMFISIFIVVKFPQEVDVIVINTVEPPSAPLNSRFLSIALDTFVIANNFKNFNMTNPKLLKLMKHLSPAYLRIGGTMADRLVFMPDDTFIFKYNVQQYEYPIPNFTMSGNEWLALNKLADSSNLKILFDLNALRRFSNGSWDYRNAESLINFSQQHNLSLIWELGNEPTDFCHKFHYCVNASQLADDFKLLRNILNKYPLYKDACLVGPDINKPKSDNRRNEIYLKEFLENGGDDVVDAVTWHQYYFDAKNAYSDEFVDPDVFDLLKFEISVIQDVTRNINFTKPIWLGETSDAFGGGARGYSDRYIASFIWLDKLGLSAENRLDVVVRQSIFNGYYALIDDNYNPTPDWWISVLFKKIVGNRTIPCYQTDSSQIRFYCHCKNKNVTMFGMNLMTNKGKVRIAGLDEPVDAYVLTKNFSLYSKLIFPIIINRFSVIMDRFRNIFLNGELLSLTEDYELPEMLPRRIPSSPYIEMPPLSIIFIVFPLDKIDRYSNVVANE